MRRTALLSDATRARASSAGRVLEALARRGRAARRPLLLHAPEPEPLPVAVVLGLVLRGDRLAALRAASARATELESLLSAMRPDGFIGHVDLLGPAAEPRRGSIYYNVASRRRRDDRDDPAAAARLGLADRGRRSRPPSRGSPPTTSGCAANRDLDGDGLLWLVQPDESGLDSSPKFDPVWGRLRARRLRLPAAGRAQPAARLGRAPDPRRGWPVLCEVMTNVLWCLARVSAGRALDHPGDRRPALGRAPRALPRRGAARRRAPRRLDLGGARAARAARPAGGDRPAPGRGAPARPGALLARAARRRRSRRPSRASSPTAAPGWMRRYWRGPTWINAAWMLWLGLRRLGYEAEAAADGRAARGDRAARGPARVLRPAHGRGPRRDRVRLDQPDPRAGRAGRSATWSRSATCSGR